MPNKQTEPMRVTKVDIMYLFRDLEEDSASSSAQCYISLPRTNCPILLLHFRSRDFLFGECRSALQALIKYGCGSEERVGRWLCGE